MVVRRTSRPRWPGSASASLVAASSMSSPQISESAQPLPLIRARFPVRLPNSSGINSAVECQLPKLKVDGSNPLSRSNEVFEFAADDGSELEPPEVG